MNINLLNRSEAREYTKCCAELSLNIENYSPTRLKVCLDHILNRGTKINSMGVLESNLSDHSMILFSIGKQRMESVSLTRQVVSNADLDRWRALPLSFVSMDGDLDRFLEEISGIASQTYKVVGTKKKRIDKEWHNVP